MNNKILYLAKEYQLVVGDNFQLFYQGVIRSTKPSLYNVAIQCEKGNPYPRYFNYLPKEDEEGTYVLTMTIFADDGTVIEEASTNLVVVKPVKPKKKQTILCIGDSLTFNGVWPAEGYRRFTQEGGTPEGLGFKDTINMIGTCKKQVGNEEIGFEGYGGWQWRHFCENDVFSCNSCVWIKANHNLNENDQHSVWESDGLKWILESITPGLLKFKRGLGNTTLTPTIGKEFHHVEGGLHFDSLKVLEYEMEMGNPFYSKTKKQDDFHEYVEKNNFTTPDFIYILLTWNGQYIPFNHDQSHHEKYMRILISKIHEEYPNCKVRILGIQSPSITGGIAANYGATGYYSNFFGTLSTCYFYNEFLENFVSQDEFKSYCKYIDTKAQFDTEYNMPYIMRPVNNRSQALEKIGTNAVHPNMDGYLQIGDVFYRSIVHDMKKEAE